MSAVPVHYFVYYRVAPGRAADANSIVRAVFADIEGRCAIAGRLMHRAHEPLLWMEIYEGVRDCPAFEVVLERSLESHGFADVLMPGTSRAVERFVAGSDAPGADP